MKHLFGLVTAVWLGCCLGGMLLLVHYNATPGLQGNVAKTWPSGIGISRSSGSLTVLLFVHPRCPCTTASIAQLKRVLSRTEKEVRLKIVFGLPKDQPAFWAKTRLLRVCAALPNVELIPDPGGSLAQQFGVVTSGHCLVYSANGRLLFNGGLTVSRGHEGDNYGAEAVRAALSGKSVPRSLAPVFGCRLITTPCSPIAGSKFRGGSTESHEQK